MFSCAQPSQCRNDFQKYPYSPLCQPARHRDLKRMTRSYAVMLACAVVDLAPELCELWKRNKVWHVFYTENSILRTAWSKWKFSPANIIFNYAAYTHINAPCIFPFWWEFFGGIYQNSVFLGHKPTAVTCFMHPKILDCILDYLSRIIPLKPTDSRWNSTNIVTTTVK